MPVPNVTRHSARVVISRDTRIHTGEKPFDCPTCHNTFRLNSQMKEHERIHTGDKPHGCPKCQKALWHRGDLKKHERTHTGDEPLACSKCDHNPFSCKNLIYHSAKVVT